MTDQEIIELMFECGVKLTKHNMIIPYHMEITNPNYSRERESEKDSPGRPARNIPVFTQLPTLQEIGERLLKHDISDLVKSRETLPVENGLSLSANTSIKLISGMYDNDD